MTKVAYCDIETCYSGTKEGQDLFRDFQNHKLTVVGLLIIDDKPENIPETFIQLVPEVPWMTSPTRESFLYAIEGCAAVITYNGRWWPAGNYNSVGFDGPVLEAQLGISWKNLEKKGLMMMDLVETCWALNLFGGQKKVEAQLGIKRLLPSKDGVWAMKMWKKWLETKDEAYLDLLLVYNKEDVYGLMKLEQALKRA